MINQFLMIASFSSEHIYFCHLFSSLRVALLLTFLVIFGHSESTTHDNRITYLILVKYTFTSRVSFSLTNAL